jgi:hypothetical protein
MRLVLYLIIISFLAQQSRGQAVVINEIMPAPSAAGFEFIELVFPQKGAISPSDISLRDNAINWSSIQFNRPISSLDTLVLVKDINDAQDLILSGIPVGTLAPWPTLNNGGDSLFVRLNNVIQDKMGYSTSFMSVSWERNSPFLPGFVSSNWSLSNSPNGSTAGQTNSVYSLDVVAPRLIGAEVRNQNEIVIWFSEPMPFGTPIQFAGGSKNQTEFIATSLPNGNRIFFNLDSRAIPEWIQISAFQDYAGNVGLPSVVPLSVPPDRNEVVISEIHFLEGGSSISRDAPEFIEILSRAGHSISLSGVDILYKSLLHNAVHPDSLVILAPFETYILSARQWSDWQLVRDQNDYWLTAQLKEPFLNDTASSSNSVFGVAPWISFNNQGAEIELLLGVQILDSISFSQDCLDSRFDDHRGRSVSRTFDPQGCQWESTPFPAGLSPGQTPGPTPIYSTPKAGDLLVTEIMFDPVKDPIDFLSDQVEFIEFVNVSDQPVALQHLWFAETADEFGLFEKVRLAYAPVALFPGQIAVLFHYPSPFPDNPFYEKNVLADAWPSSKPSWFASEPFGTSSALNNEPLQQHFRSSEYNTVFIPTRRPLNLSNSKGRYRILASSGEEIAVFTYDSKDHYSGLESTKGRSLYRPLISTTPSLFSWQFGSWTTTTNPEGATPGAVVHILPTSGKTGSLRVTPLSFYPEFLELPHEVQIQVKSENPSDLVVLEVFDRQGYLVRTIENGRFLDSGWTTSWDGQNDIGAMCQLGVYILVARIFDDEGKELSRIKQPVSVLRGKR